MNEASWLAAEDPIPMLDFLGGGNPLRPECPAPPPSPRKLRLFACACCRQAWHLLTDPRGRRAVEVAERYADGLATAEEMRFHRSEAHAVLLPRHLKAWVCCHSDVSGVVPDFLAELGPEGKTVPAQAALLRDIFGNPFRPWSRRPPAAPEDWDAELCLQECRTPAVLGIARRAYDCHDFAALPILADALEEAGCEGEGLLRHLRGQERCPLYYAPSGGPRDCAVCGARRSVDHGWVPLRGPHARGCWALDRVLGMS